jgi:hypothetical protein
VTESNELLVPDWVWQNQMVLAHGRDEKQEAADPEACRLCGKLVSAAEWPRLYYLATFRRVRTVICSSGIVVRSFHGPHNITGCPVVPLFCIVAEWWGKDSVIEPRGV